MLVCIAQARNPGRGHEIPPHNPEPREPSRAETSRNTPEKNTQEREDGSVFAEYSEKLLRTSAQMPVSRSRKWVKKLRKSSG